MLPSCNATAEAQRSLLVSERQPEGEVAHAAAVEEACRAGKDKDAKVTIMPRHVKNRIQLLRAGAQAGGSRCPNDVLIAASEVRGGVQTLVQWCQPWCDGAIPPVMTACLQEQTLRPLRKPNGKPRNISLMEMILKFATGVVQDAIREAGVLDGTGEG